MSCCPYRCATLRSFLPRARLHRRHRAHAAVRLEAPVGCLAHVAGRFVDAREKSAEHDRGRARADRLGDVAGLLDAGRRR